MGDVVNLAEATAPKVTTDEYFGGCPHCGGYDYCRNIGRAHWMCCDTHKTKWFIGENLFSSWREEDEETWRATEYLLSNYMEVVPLEREPTDEEKVAIEEADRERAMLKTFGVVLRQNYPVQCANSLGDLEQFTQGDWKYQPDKLFVLLHDNRAYDLDRAAAFEAYDAYEAGDRNAIATFLASLPIRLVPDIIAATPFRP